jgi:enoyl-CoA hydratase/carnithine racemase
MAIETGREGRLLRITLNRPEKRNALNLAMCREISGALSEANGDPGIGAVLISGAGKAYCAGMDLSEAPDVDGPILAEAHERLFTFHEWMDKPVVAAVHGVALGGGTGLAANAHILIASEDAVFGLPEVRLGLWPVLIFPAIASAMGERRAVELSVSARNFSAREAATFGLVSEVVSAERLEARAVEVATGLAQNSADAIRAGLAYVRAIRGKSLSAALAVGRVAREELMQQPDFDEGVRAFREKRAAVWPSHLREKAGGDGGER